jgi:hypothetical protein
MKTSDWNNPTQSSEDMGRDKLRKDSSGLGYSKPRSIARVVDENNDRSGGFAARLDKGTEE